MARLSDNVLSDEILMSYADGMLDPAERARVAAALAGDAEAARRLKVFELTRDRLAQAYRPVAEAAVPRHLADLVRSFPVSEARAQPRGAVAGGSSIVEALKSLFMPRGLGLAGAFAYTLTFLAGAGATWLALGRAPQGAVPTHLAVTADGRIGAAGALAAALERTLSVAPGVPGADSAHGPVSLESTFKSAHGYCRQYNLAATPGSRLSGIACREADGRWIIQAQLPAAVQKRAADGPVVASAPGEIVTLVERMSTADALSREDEAERIARGWRD